jgi:hypothetical protein
MIIFFEFDNVHKGRLQRVTNTRRVNPDELIIVNIDDGIYKISNERKNCSVTFVSDMSGVRQLAKPGFTVIIDIFNTSALDKLAFYLMKRQNESGGQMADGLHNFMHELDLSTQEGHLMFDIYSAIIRVVHTMSHLSISGNIDMYTAMFHQPKLQINYDKTEISRKCDGSSIDSNSYIETFLEILMEEYK